MTIHIGERQEDFIAQLLTLIQEGKKQQAVEKILNLSDDDKLQTIQALLSQNDQTLILRLHLSIATSYSKIKNSTLVRNRSLVRDRPLVRDIALSLAQASALAGALGFTVTDEDSRGSALDYYVLGMPDNYIIKIVPDLPALDDLVIITPSQIKDLNGLNNYPDFARVGNAARLRDAVRALTKARVLANDLASGLVQTSTRARTRARDLAITLNRALDLVRSLNSFNSSDILRCSIEDIINIAEITLLLISGNLSSDKVLEASSNYHQKLADALDEVLYLRQQGLSDIFDIIIEVIEILLEGKVRHITLDGVDKITPEILTNQIGPFLQGLNNYLKIHSELTNTEFAELRIVQVHNVLPTVELLGAVIGPAKDLFEYLRTRKDTTQSRQLADEAIRLDNEKKQIELDSLKAATKQKNLQEETDKSTLEAEARVKLIEAQARARKAEIDADLALVELEKRKHELRREIRNSYIEDAIRLIEKIAPHLSSEERLVYVANIAANLRQMDETGLVGRFGWHDTPRPDSLPGLPKSPETS